MTGIAGDQVGVFGDYSNIPDNFQAAIRSGVNFFELRAEKPITFARQIQGPFSVEVTEEFAPAFGRTRFITNWITGARANVRFEIFNPKTGLAKAFMPDDPWWHNRILMADNRDLQNIHAYHTRDGMFPGTRFREEINALFMAITVDSTEYTILNAQKRMIGSYQTKQEAEADIQAHKFQNYTVVDRKIRIKSPEIIKMISNWTSGATGSRYGWTDCPEFKKIQEAIREKFKQDTQAAQPNTFSLAPTQFNAAVVAAIKAMSIEERKALLHDVTEGQQRQETFSGKEPRRMGIGELKQRARELKIKIPRGAGRDEIIQLLREKGEDIIDEKAQQEAKTMQADHAPAEKEEVVR